MYTQIIISVSTRVLVVSITLSINVCVSYLALLVSNFEHSTRKELQLNDMVKCVTTLSHGHYYNTLPLYISDYQDQLHKKYINCRVLSWLIELFG